jgi:hypothetical protein
MSSLLPSHGSRISVSWVPSAAQIPEELWAACFPPSLEGHWWYSTLEKSGLDDQFAFSYALIKRAGQLIGIAPVFVTNVPIDLVAPPLIAALLKKIGRVIPRARYQRTLFVGSPCADEGTIGLLPGIDLATVVLPLWQALQERAIELRANMIVWKDLPEGYAPALEDELAAGTLFKVTAYPGTRVALSPCRTLKGYFESLSSSHRHNLRKKLRRSREASRLISTVVENPTEQLLHDEILPLFWQTYERGKTKFEKLTPEFFRRIAALPYSRFVLLRNQDTGKLVAFMLCFRLGSKVINKFIGIDYGCDPGWFLYFRLWEAAVEWSLTAGATEIQSGQTGYRAKIDVGHSLIPLNSYCRHRNPFINRLFAYVARSIEWRSLDEDLRIYLEAHPEADLCGRSERKNAKVPVTAAETP